MSSIIVTEGNLVADPHLRLTANGTPVASATLAVTDRVKRPGRRLDRRAHQLLRTDRLGHPGGQLRRHRPQGRPAGRRRRTDRRGIHRLGVGRPEPPPGSPPPTSACPPASPPAHKPSRRARPLPPRSSRSHRRPPTVTIGGTTGPTSRHRLTGRVWPGRRPSAIRLCVPETRSAHRHAPVRILSRMRRGRGSRPRRARRDVSHASHLVGDDQGRGPWLSRRVSVIRRRFVHEVNADRRLCRPRDCADLAPDRLWRKGIAEV